MNHELKLLVEWSSPWQEFRTSLGPALGRSPAHLPAEARTGLVPYRGMLLTWIGEALLLVVLIVLPGQVASMRPNDPPSFSKYDVIYFSPDELPRTEDTGGAQPGRSGRAGGQEAHHRTQTIRVARGSLVRDKIVDAPNLKLPVANTPVANLLAYKAIPGPPPAEGVHSSRQVPALSQSVVPPAPDVERSPTHNQPTLIASVIAPAPSPLPQDMPAVRIPGMQAVQVVPPPVSAPERATTLNPRLTLPAPNVVAPAPVQAAREFSPRGPGFGPGELQKQVVPPPVQLGNRSLTSPAGASLGGGPTVVAPPVQLGSTLGSQGRIGLEGSVAVVPPAPSLTGSGPAGGHGHGNRGAGLGSPLDVGSVAAPPSSGGSGGGSGIVLSSQPGTKVAMPGNGGSGSLALSPSGGAKPGLGGSGGGSGISPGNGPGSGFGGEGSGAGHEGAGHGSDPNSRSGISPYPGPAGTSTASKGTPPLPGVSVRGGSANIITLPSFGPSGNPPADPGRSPISADPNQSGITIVATSRSGGALGLYGYLKGDPVYSIYLVTPMGPAVMQYAGKVSAGSYNGDLIAPQPLRADMPSGLPHSRLVIGFTLDRSGFVQHPRELEHAPAALSTRVLAAMSKWKFRPAMHGNQGVEVDAVLGFNIDTSDRNTADRTPTPKVATP
jgi:hypothetical protein